MSLFGDSALWLAMGIWIKVLTGSSSAASLSFFALGVGSLCCPLGGVLADKVRHRPLLIVTNLVTAGLVLLLLLVRDRHQVWLIYAVMLGYGVSGSVLGPAQTALVQSIVPAELLGDANGILQTARQGMRLITPLAGAGLFAAFGAVPVAAGDAATFLIATATLLPISLQERRPASTMQGWRAQLTAGGRYIIRTVALRQLTVTAAVVVTAYGLSEPVIFAVVSQGLRKPAAFLGILIAAQGVGALAAGSFAAPLMRRLGEGWLSGLGILSAAVGFLLLIAPPLPAVLAGCALLGASLSWIIVGVMTLFQRRTPPELMGRTDAAFTIMYAIPQTAAIALGAGLIAVLNYRILLLVIAGLMTLGAIYLLTRREQRRVSSPQTPQSALQAAAGPPWSRRPGPRDRGCAAASGEAPAGFLVVPELKSRQDTCGSLLAWLPSRR